MKDRKDSTNAGIGLRTAQPATYEIVVEGVLGPAWQPWLDDLTIEAQVQPEGAPTTTLVGTVADQAALRGTLGRLWDLNLVLVSVRRRDI